MRRQLAALLASVRQHGRQQCQWSLWGQVRDLLGGDGDERGLAVRIGDKGGPQVRQAQGRLACLDMGHGHVMSCSRHHVRVRVRVRVSSWLRHAHVVTRVRMFWRRGRTAGAALPLLRWAGLQDGGHASAPAEARRPVRRACLEREGAGPSLRAGASSRCASRRVAAWRRRERPRRAGASPAPPV